MGTHTCSICNSMFKLGFLGSPGTVLSQPVCDNCRISWEKEENKDITDRTDLHLNRSYVLIGKVRDIILENIREGRIVLIKELGKAIQFEQFLKEEQEKRLGELVRRGLPIPATEQKAEFVSQEKQ